MGSDMVVCSVLSSVSRYFYYEEKNSLFIILDTTL